MMMFQAGPTYTNFVSYQNGMSTILSSSSITALGSQIESLSIALVAVTALIGVYAAFVDGGNVRALSVTFLKYVIAAYIISNWTSLFSTMITDMLTVTQNIAGTSSTTQDVFDAFQQSLNTYYSNTGNGSLMQWFNNATGQVLLTVLTALCAFAEAAAYAFFCLWYTFWGAILWGIGPIIIALLPSSGLGKYATAYLSKVGEWLLWPVLYAILGSLMTALNMTTASNLANPNATNAQMSGTIFVIESAVALGVCLITIPFTAHALVSGQFSFVGGAVLGVAAKAASMVSGGAKAVDTHTKGAQSEARAQRGEARAERMEAMAMARSGGQASGSGGGRMPPPPTPAPST
jgi:ABC-type multidrug transport system fused ATPase/permease subunit